MRVTVAPQEEAVDLELDEIQKTAALGPDPPQATPNTPAWRIREQRIAVRSALERVLTLEHGTEQDLPASLKGEVAKALDAARQHLRGVTEQAHDQAVNVMEQLDAHRQHAIRGDAKLSDDAKEIRRLRRQGIVRALDGLDDTALHGALDDDSTAEALLTAPKWMRDKLGILPTTLQAAADRLFERRAPQAFASWQAAREQVKGLRHEVDMAASAAVTTEVQESDITAN